MQCVCFHDNLKVFTFSNSAKMLLKACMEIKKHYIYFFLLGWIGWKRMAEQHRNTISVCIVFVSEHIALFSWIAISDHLQCSSAVWIIELKINWDEIIFPAVLQQHILSHMSQQWLLRPTLDQRGVKDCSCLRYEAGSQSSRAAEVHRTISAHRPHWSGNKGSI